MSDLHPSTQRLYHVVERLRGVRGQSNVARLFNISPQTMRNWEVRGMSREGALAAEAELGVSAHWLLTGVTAPGGLDPMGDEAPPLGGPFIVADGGVRYSARSAPCVRTTLEDLAEQLAGSDVATRGSVAPLLAKLAESPELAPRLIRALEALLAEPRPAPDAGR